MPNTYTLLETITVGAAGAASVTFNSIPQTGYTDLKVVFSARGDSNFNDCFLKFNGVNTNQSMKYLYGTGLGAASATDSLFYMLQVRSTYTANTFSSSEFYVPNYTSSNFKSVSLDQTTENNTNTSTMYLGAQLWSSTAAITSMTLNPVGGNFAQYSTFSLYGVSALGVTPTKAPKATGGSIIQTDGTYWYHAFLSSGTFTPATALTCDVLVVGGGGGGGTGYYTAAGGGGAGGVFYATSQSVGTSAQTVTVGAGGAGGTIVSGGPNVNGANGNNSSFASLTAGVGGGGSGTGAVNGNNGGSGGGAGAGTSALGGTSTQTSTGGTGYGNAGGRVFVTTSAAGGGGAGAVGTNGLSSGAGGQAGGAGLNTWSSWLSTTGLGVSGFIAGGGGAGDSGAGGSGGGGTGGAYDASFGTVGRANTGGGGAGGAGQNTIAYAQGLAGGSGLVIVRYLAA